MNKMLSIITILLIPITIISFYKKETNFIMEENKHIVDNIYINLENKGNIKKIELEEYVIGVVAGEMPALFEIEALKAQAIASRTYAYNNYLYENKLESNTNDQVYITKDEMKEKWKEKYELYYEKIKEAVLSTKGLIMTYNNMPIKAYYFAMSNGYTENSINVFNQNYDYLKIKESKWDKDNESEKIITKEELCSLLEIECNEIIISNIQKDESNRIDKLLINNKLFTGLEIRKKLNLRSTDFLFEIGENIIIKTKGYGHGVGMSQYGANNMAKENYNYKEILEYYYDGIKIEEI